MRYRLTAFRWSFLLLLTTVLCANILSLAAQGIQRTSKLDASAAPTNGEVPLSRMILLLAPTAAQQKNLDALLSAQVTQGNASFHQWLTPAQFATRFANTEAEAATVSSWLHGQGLTVAPLPASRGWIEFSGTPAQVEHAFGVRVVPIPAGTEVQTRYQLVGSPHLPATVASLVTGVVSLDGVESTLAATVAPVISTTGLATSTLTPTCARRRRHFC
jgi:subtilase family serine protease